MRHGFLITAFALALATVGCAHKSHHGKGKHGCSKCGDHETKEAPAGQAGAAEAIVSPIGKKGKVKGTVKFVAAGEDLRVMVNLSGLKPNQKQGFHIHEFGNCSSSDGSAAGGHLNLAEKTHGSLTDEARHTGDLGNLEGGAKGVSEVEIVLPKTSLQQIVGRSVLLHSQEDDLKSQPAGASGERVACGIIGLTQ